MRGNPSMDRLSSLNDDLLLRIIRCLPAKDLVATSILSRRWRYLWHFTSILWLDSRHFPSPQSNHFMDFVDYVLRHCHSRNIHHFKLVLCHPCDKNRVRHWVNFATQANLQHLQIIIAKKVFPLGERFTLPSSIFNFQSLKYLIISIANCGHMYWPTYASFPSLEYLSLSDFKFVNTTRDAISASCPHLKRLKMLRCIGLRQLTVCCPYLEAFCMENCYNIHDLTISSPRLELFSIKSTFAKVKPAEISSFGIQAPNLKTFQWIDRSLHHFCNAEMPSVTNSIVHLKSPKYPSERELHLSLSKTIQLTIDCISIVNCLIQELDHSSSYQNVQVLKLLIDFNVVKFVGTICGALRCFPNLTTLEINTEESSQNTVDGNVVSTTHDRCNMYQLLLLQKLVQVEVHKFQGTPCEMELIKFILEIASSLQRMTIRTSSDSMTSSASTITEELLKLPSASSNLRFSLVHFLFVFL